MGSIDHLCWGRVPVLAAPHLVSPSERLLAVWPSPLDHDSCFTEAGFVEFADSDEQWDLEWKRIAESLMATFREYGVAWLLNAEAMRVVKERRWSDWLCPWSLPSRFESLSPVERLLLSTDDDRFLEAVVEFGSPPAVTVRTSSGHPIFWIALTQAVVRQEEELVQHIAAGTPIRQYILRWEHLLGGTQSHT